LANFELFDGNGSLDAAMAHADDVGGDVAGLGAVVGYVGVIGLASKKFQCDFDARQKADRFPPVWNTVRSEPGPLVYPFALQRLSGVFSWRSAALRSTKQVSTLY